MIIIQKMTVTKPFRYLWLKSVKGVNLDEHCAKCILGEYSGAISTKGREFHDIQLSGDMYYLCGVSQPYKWENNFHLAFRYKKGEAIAYDSNGISVVILNAERIVFSEADIDLHHPNASKRAYSTCRNWQFANWYRKNIEG